MAQELRFVLKCFGSSTRVLRKTEQETDHTADNDLLPPTADLPHRQGASVPQKDGYYT